MGLIKITNSVYSLFEEWGFMASSSLLLLPNRKAFEVKRTQKSREKSTNLDEPEIGLTRLWIMRQVSRVRRVQSTQMIVRVGRV